MAEFCDWLAVIFLFIALVLAVLEARPVASPPASRWSWAFAVAGLLAFMIPVAMAASGISVS